MGSPAKAATAAQQAGALLLSLEEVVMPAGDDEEAMMAVVEAVEADSIKDLVGSGGTACDLFDRAQRAAGRTAGTLACPFRAMAPPCKPPAGKTECSRCATNKAAAPTGLVEAVLPKMKEKLRKRMGKALGLGDI